MGQDLLDVRYPMGDARSSLAPSMVTLRGTIGDSLTYQKVIHLCQCLVMLLAGGGGGAASTRNTSAHTNWLWLFVLAMGLMVRVDVDEGLCCDDAGVLFKFLSLNGKLMFEGIELLELVSLGSSFHHLPFWDKYGYLLFLKVVFCLLKGTGLEGLEMGVVKPLSISTCVFLGRIDFCLALSIEAVNGGLGEGG